MILLHLSLLERHYKNPEHVQYFENKNQFIVLKLNPISSIGYLKLNRLNHIRVEFKKDDDWKGQFFKPMNKAA